MIQSLLLTLVAAIAGYFGQYPREADEAIIYAVKNRSVIETINRYLPGNEGLEAMCIVAPEVSQYSKFYDAAEVYALAALYVNAGRSDFSVGPFQMKPSFAEDIERRIKADDSLYKKYEALIIDNNGREGRGTRVSRLSSLKWQIVYLSAFYEIALHKVSAMTFKDADDRFCYLATLYNGGMGLSKQQVEARMRMKQFPRRGSVKFNYASIAAEYLAKAEYCRYLRK